MNIHYNSILALNVSRCFTRFKQSEKYSFRNQRTRLHNFTFNISPTIELSWTPRQSFIFQVHVAAICHTLYKETSFIFLNKCEGSLYFLDTKMGRMV